MKCEDCDEPATVHSSVIVNGAQSDVHLCRACAERRHVISKDAPVPSSSPGFPAGGAKKISAKLAAASCPDCGVKYMDFRNSARLGCPYDYVVFRDGLIQLLDHVHSATHHRGKRPRRWRTPIESHSDTRQLRLQLRFAVEAEEFNEAARLRDLIRTKETGNGL